MEKKLIILFLGTGVFFILNTPAHAQQEQLGTFENYSEIGDGFPAGSTTYHASTQTYELTYSCINNPGNQEGIHFLWKRMTGNFILFARGRFAGKETDPHGKMGWMIRSSLDANAACVNAVVHGDGLSSLQFRKKKGDSVLAICSALTHADVIQLERKDSNYIMRIARFGAPFVTEQVTGLNLGDEVYVGLFVGSVGKDLKEQKATFQDVRITLPVDENLVLLRTDIGSNLEILDIETDSRKLIYTDSNSLHSPIWKKTGNVLIYGKQGFLYTFDLNKRTSQRLYTGDVPNNNNDHVLSFDGTKLAICVSVQQLSGRVIFTVPVTGGTPKLLTRAAPAYPHGWSPDGKNLLFAWSNKGEYDIYKIPAWGGKAVRLTTAKGRDDCPEYTPDGKYIYFNSNRTGTMLLWRMKPDGSKQEPVTNGEFHDWFPHISPDGKWIVFLSYSKDEVSPAGNPSYRQVYLRLMPVSGGQPKIIAYLYGGQGTINSPCWSPDSKRIAFASYSDIKQ